MLILYSGIILHLFLLKYCLLESIYHVGGVIYNILFYLNYLVFNTVIIIFTILIHLRNVRLLFLFGVTGTLLIGETLLKSSAGITWITTLSYGFNLVHPLIFYLTVIYTIVSNFAFKKIYRINLINLLSLLIFTMYLGMCWGSINSGWGFFWTNDSIEYILLFFILINLYLSHYFVRSEMRWGILYFILTVIIILFLVRFNVVFSVHSFFSTPLTKAVIFLFIFMTTLRYSIFLIYIYLIGIVFSCLITIISVVLLIRAKDQLFKKIIIYLWHIFFVSLVIYIFINFYFYSIINTQLYVQTVNLKIYSTIFSSIKISYIFLESGGYIIIKYIFNTIHLFNSLIFFNHYSYFLYMAFFYYFIYFLLISMGKTVIKLNT